MKSDATILTHLNRILFNELTAINQYFLHGKILKDRGFAMLGGKAIRESIDEMHHAGQLVDRVLFLEGMPNMQNLGKLMIGETVPEMLQSDLTLELNARKDLQDAIACAEQQRDYVSRDLLRGILAAEEEHIDWLETQLGLIQQVGLQNYLQSQMSASDTDS